MGIEFNEDLPTDYNYSPKKFSITDLVIKMGLAKDNTGARKVMIVVMIIFFALSIYFFYQALF